MNYDPSNPLIVQGDRSILVEVDNPKYAKARDALAPFAELEKSPEHIHTYRLTPLSLWNAAAAGHTAEAMVEVLRRYSKFPLPKNLPADIFYAGGNVRGGSGVIVLPCGAGKTIVGIAAMAAMQRSALVLTTSITAVKQWHREILDKTDIAEDQIAEYTGESKQLGPITLATYQILTHRPDKKEEFPHFKIFDERD